VEQAATRVLRTALSVLSAADGHQAIESVRAPLRNLAAAEEKISTVVAALWRERRCVYDEQPVPGNGTIPALIKDVLDFRSIVDHMPSAEPFRDLDEGEPF